jgi:hypothetical protein
VHQWGCCSVVDERLHCILIITLLLIPPWLLCHATVSSWCNVWRSISMPVGCGAGAVRWQKSKQWARLHNVVEYIWAWSSRGRGSGSTGRYYAATSCATLWWLHWRIVIAVHHHHQRERIPLHGLKRPVGLLCNTRLVPALLRALLSPAQPTPAAIVDAESKSRVFEV